jgi:uncharacterized protein (TIGR03435 family)
VKLARPFVALFFFLTFCTAIFLVSPTSHAQSPSQAASQSVPDWQTAAGGKAMFDIASVKRDTAEPSQQTVYSNIPLGPRDVFVPTGGLFSATNMPLIQYIIFAYKLTPPRTDAVIAQLPKWANTDRYDIQARTIGNPSKDQFRLMMQALLADRFKLAIHYEARQMPVFALVLNKPGKLGPKLQPHSGDVPCSLDPGALQSAATVAGGFPLSCSSAVALPPSNPGRLRVGVRNMTLAGFATTFFFTTDYGVDRPVLDKTGLAGEYDYLIEFTPPINGPLPPGSTFQPDESGPTFLEALKEQLGLKLSPQTGPVDLLTIDHVEEPSEN